MCLCVCACVCILVIDQTDLHGELLYLIQMENKILTYYENANRQIISSNKYEETLLRKPNIYHGNV
jgi:hypothetical protein